MILGIYLGILYLDKKKIKKKKSVCNHVGI